MKRAMTHATAALLIALAAVGPANAASLDFVPLTPTSNLSPGDIVSLQVWLDFSDVVDDFGTPVGTLGGGWDILYDPTLIAFTGLDFQIVGDPAFARPPDILPGILESWSAGDFNGIIGPVLAGTVSFEVIASGPFTTSIWLRESLGLAGTWVSAGDFVSIIVPEYDAVTLTGVPLPATGWLLMPAIAALAALRKG